jgi:gas vesicle protein
MTSEDLGQASRSDSILMAFVLGALTGAAAAMLLAPAAGRDTRHTIGRKAREARDGASRALDQGRMAIRQRTDRVTAFVGRTRERIGGATHPRGRQPDADSQSAAGASPAESRAAGVGIESPFGAGQ